MNPEVQKSKLSDPDTHGLAQWAILLAILAAVLSIVWIVGHSMSLEESANLQLSHQSTKSIIIGSSQAAQMPLYYLLLHFIGSLLSFRPTVARLFSLMCYVIALVVAFYTAKQVINDKRAGYTMVALLGLSPFMVWFSDKVTAYCLLSLMSLINYNFFVRVLAGKRSGRIGYVISGLAGLATHYIFGMLLLTQLGFCVLRRRSISRQVLIPLLISSGVFVGALGWWLTYASNLGPFWHNAPHVGAQSATDVFITFVQFLFGFQSVTTTTLILAFWPLLVIVALLAVQKYVRPTLNVQYFIWAAFIPIGAAFALGWIWPVFLSFYLIICLPAFLVLISWFLTAYELKTFILVRTVLLVVMALMLFVELFLAKTPLHANYPPNHHLTDQAFHTE